MSNRVSKRIFCFALQFSLLSFAAIGLAQTPRAEIFRLPAYKRIQLPNGLTLLLLEKHELPLISIELVLRSGSVADPPGKEGLASLTASLLRKGTATRSSEQVSSDLDFIGMKYDAHVNQDATRISVDFPSKDAAAALPLLADILLHPTFPEPEMKKRIDQMRDSFHASKDDPRLVIQIYFMKFLYGDHPYGQPVDGDELSLANHVGREDVAGFYRRNYTPGNAILAVAGDFDQTTLQSKIEQIFGSWSGATPPVVSVTALKPPPGKRVLLVDKPDATQTYFMIGNVGISSTNGDRGYISVVNTLLGGRFTSLLNSELRIKSGYSYFAYSHFDEMRAPGPFFISTYTKNATTEPAIDKSLDVLARLHQESLSAEDIVSAKAYIGGTLPPQFETTPQLASTMATLELYGITRDQFNENLVKQEGTTATDVRHAIDTYFPNQDYVIVMIGKANEISKIAGKYGPNVTTKKISDPGF